ncbi:MAG: rhodanese-related sulfurtransferase [Chitinophagales bacterium]
MQLHNKVDKRVLKERLMAETFQRVTLSFYQYAHIKDPGAFRDELYQQWDKRSVFGRVYVATEGINGQISVPEHHFEQMKTELYAIDFLDGVRLNIAVDDDGKSFYKLKIKVRPKIVADGLTDDTFDVTDKGVHLQADEFNELVANPDTVLVDMRNHYESEVGHFKGAVTPDVDTFRDSLPIIEDMLEGKEDKNLVMYCTGGIRCEKASAYFKHKGFQNVFQLEGGIIEYARQVEEKGLENKFIGKNFVFDERLGERITEDIISNCHTCGEPCDTHTNCVNEACHILFIQCENCKTKYNACCSVDCQTVYELPEETQKELRKGKKMERNIYRKGRLRPKLNG